MQNRVAVVLAGCFAAGLLASGVASAAPTPVPEQEQERPLTKREEAGLEMAGRVLGSLLPSPVGMPGFY